MTVHAQTRAPDDDGCCGRPLLLTERQATPLMNEPTFGGCWCVRAVKLLSCRADPRSLRFSLYVLNETSGNEDK